MLALVNTADDNLTALLTVDDPTARPDEAIVEVRAFSLSRGELSLLRTRPQGWRPGQDIAGTIAVLAADGSGPAQGQRVVASPRVAAIACPVLA